MSKQTMSEIIASYNSLAAEQGKEEVTSFKNLAAARAALKTLESHMSNDTPETEVNDTPETEVNDTPETEVTETGAKYNSTKKRGPTQGIGAFCKEQILDGKTNAEILAMVAEQFPTAKTTSNCVAYYRVKLKVVPVAVEDDVAEETEEEVAA